MDFKDLDKRQLILLTLLITFVVSIATAIVSVSLVKKMPASVPQTINNVIQRTIEKVTTVEVPASAPITNKETLPDKVDNNSGLVLANNDALIAIYKKDQKFESETGSVQLSDSLGQGVIISDMGLVLVESSILHDGDLYKVLLDKTVFDATILKKFDNGFSILKISIEAKIPSEITPNESVPPVE